MPGIWTYPTVRMKSHRINPYSMMEDEMYETEELQELLYAKLLVKLKEKEEEEARMRQELWNLFFAANICFLHDREWCAECRVYGKGICPSAREELPHDF